MWVGGVASHLTIRQKFSMTVYSLTSLLTYKYRHREKGHILTHTKIITIFKKDSRVSRPHSLLSTLLGLTNYSHPSSPFVSAYKQRPLIYNQGQHLHQLAMPKENAGAAEECAQTPLRVQMVIKDWHQQEK